MLYTIESALRDCWHVWSGLFAPLPYGDPYLAGAALTAIILFLCMLIVSGRARS
ncbi:MAG: hypothetical protein OXR84_02360 [Magnetovibrio sp.]|nr:hypothetical protein [Magnetovibrio sp.]